VSPWLPLQFLANGVTTLREMGNRIDEENRTWIAETQKRGLDVPLLLFSGPVLDGPNTPLPDQSIVLMDEVDARCEARRLMGTGATSLKVYSRLSLSLMKIVIEEAHRRNVPVHAHLGAVNSRDAIDAASMVWSTPTSWRRRCCRRCRPKPIGRRRSRAAIREASKPGAGWIPKESARRT